MTSSEPMVVSPAWTRFGTRFRRWAPVGSGTSGGRRPGRAPRWCALLLVGVALTLPPAATSATATAPGAGEAPGAGTSASPGAGYLSRPDIDAPALVTTGKEPPGMLFVTPDGPDQGATRAALYDDGELVWWSEPAPGRRHFDLEPVTYRGEPALVVWEGGLAPSGVAPPGGAGTDTEYLVLDQSYQEVASFSTSGGLTTDSHDIEFSEDGSHVLLMSYEPTTRDLSPHGGPADATVIDMVVQEQEVATGETTFEWRALDHVPVTETQESLSRPGTGGVFDPIHLNSLEYDADGDILASGRNTSTVYRIDRDTGEIVWRFGGENSDFAFADPADMPSAQHDARRLPDGRLSVFDNGNGHRPRSSRGAVYALDEEAMTADLVSSLRPETPVHGPITGSNRHQENGDQLVSFGNTGVIAGFADGEEVFTAELEDGYMTYRAEFGDWHATPATPPDVVLTEPAEDGARTAYLSWNGATEIAGWRVEAGPAEDDLRTVATAPKAGFETAATFVPPESAEVYRITALDTSGSPLGSRTVTP
ncbi:arylsulfotransferase family protein [Streptomyces sp. B6B3]|uniref:arylsulfotransferase family protein n=1 Tax=Streptomyces sp. B6B3 TaxID=3153570 RepID=UPI00325ECDD1